MEVGAEDVEQVVGELRRDFEGTCVAIAGELASSGDPTHWLHLLIVLVQDGQSGSQDVGLSDEQVERLDMDFLPQVVQLLLGKSFDVRTVEDVNKFLQWTLARVAKRFQEGDTSRVSCLARVLDAHRRFYLYHGTSNDGTALNRGQETENNEKDESTEFQALRFTERDSSEYTSRYFMLNLEHWGQVGGFSLFLEVLAAGASFEVLQCILRVVYDVKDHLCAVFLAEYFPKLVDAVCTHIRKLQAAEFYALSRDSLLEVVQVMELLLLKIQHNVDIIDTVQRNGQAFKTENDKDSVDESGSGALLARELCEQRVQLLRLEISLRFFQSNSLEKRIYGLTEVVVIITRLYNDQIQEQLEPTAASLYSTLSFLVDWMHEKQLMQELLGDKMHVELIKRSTSLFQFASELECLPTEWIDLVWSCYHSDTESAGESRPVQRRHEAFRSTIHDLLMEMVTFVELPSLNHLVARIEAVRAKLDSNQLCLFAAIAARRLVCRELPERDDSTDAPRQRSLRQQILMHLWTVVLPSNTSMDFCDEVLVRMHEMLRSEAVGEEGGENEEEACVNNYRSCEMVDELLCSCLDNISRRENLAMSLKLFTQLSSLVAEMGIVLAPHQHNKSYVKFLLDEIVIYKQEVRQALQVTQWRHMDDDERETVPVLKDHVNDIKNRLLALRASWILDIGESVFVEDQLDVVWHLMIAEAFLLDEAALCFQWIELCMNTPVQLKNNRPESETAGSSQALMPLRMAEYLVTKKFPSLPGQCITLSTLCCFHSIFRRINLVKGGLEIFSTASPVGSDLVLSPTNKTTSGSSSGGDKDESVELMTGQPLVGLDELWQLAVSASDPAVAEEIITLLANFHLAFAPNVQQTEVPFRCKMQYVEKCMEFIATAKADAEKIRTCTFSPASDRPEATDKSVLTELAASVAVVNRCIDLLRYFLEACKIGDDSEDNANEALMDKLESEGISLSTDSDGSGEASKKPFQIEHLEERLPYLEIYPSPMKDVQSDPSIGAKLGYRAARRPSWTFRQQHALLDVIVDANEEVDTEDTDQPQKDEEAGSALLRRSLDSPASRRSESECSPLKVELRADLLNKSGSPIKSSMRSPCVRANLRWPQAPSPQRGPDLRPEDVDEALTDYSGGAPKLYVKDERQSCLPLEDAQSESSKRKARYGVMSQVLANQGAHFDVLLELVDWDETTSQRTWDLLCCLPTNNELLRKMIRLRRADKDQDNCGAGVGGDVDWSDLLDGSSIQRLLYALRLVEALLIPLETTGNETLRTGILRSGLRDSSYDTVEASASSSGSEEMINFIHDKLLFGDTPNDHDTPSPPVCRAIPTRELAQTLLLTLIFPQTGSLQRPDIDRDPANLNRDMCALLNRLRGYQARVLETVNLAGRQWNYAPADSFLDTTKSTHHAGLVNPGCICYMNALVQQLFMMPGFCGGLLALDSSQIPVDRSSSSWKDEVEQLQKLFASLAYTNYRSCDPTAFALSHIDMDGNSTDVHLQMDADEFFSLLLDRLEMLIRPETASESNSSGGTESNDDKDFMARCFGGVLVNQILTQQGNLSEREEKFFALSLEVSKKRHLAESLELYVQGESLEGENAYFCEREQRKVSATKRVCIKTLPQTLVCHLKRFEFDYDTMEKVKINGFLEFPMELDMLPYTSDALAATDSTTPQGQCEQAIMYDLVGVVVHSGTSDTGHYYSFIKDRHELESERWLEFNDEVVREFDVDTMGEECFGGEEVAQKWDSIQCAYSPIVQMKRRSAYMLIYERRSVNEKLSSASCATESMSLSNPVEKLATQIIQENVRYECIVNAFDPSYKQFIRDLVEGVTRRPLEFDTTLARQACQLGCQFLFGIRPLCCRTPTSSTSSPSSPSAKGSKDSVQISLWLSGYSKNSSGEANDQRVKFSQWILAGAVGSPTASLTSAALHLVESQRTWLFDVLFLSPENPFLADSCFQVLLAAVRILAQEAAAENVDAEQSLTNFLCEVLNLFFSREPRLEVCDPASGCVLTLSIDVRVTAMKQLGAFIEQCVSGPADCEESMTTEIRVIHRVFLENVQFLNRFLTTLQIPFEAADITASTVNSPISSRGIAPLAIETRAATPLREHDLRLCTSRLETKLLKHLLQDYEEPAPLSVDSTLLLNHTALKNVVLLGLEDTVVPVLTRIVFESENPSSKCDRLVALLIGVLEEVKDTHAEKVLAVFGGLLDAEDVHMKSLEEAGDLSSVTWTVHRHVFSPSRGLLESVVYYRDHRGSHNYTLVVLGFTVHRASRSLMLQELFMNDPQFCSHVNWIPGWLVDHLDSSGSVRMQWRGHGSESGGLVSSKSQELQEVEELFAEVEKAFGVTVPAYRLDAAHDDLEEEQPVLLSPPASPTAVAAEDVILEAIDLDNETQHESVKRHVGGGRWLGKSTSDEIGPEHEGAEVEAHEGPKPDWKLHRSREELSMLLRIDLDITHKNAPEA
ncbi:hypothetical protein PRIC2_004980 [Phytophthora ramorum]